MPRIASFTSSVTPYLVPHRFGTSPTWSHAANTPVLAASAALVSATGEKELMSAATIVPRSASSSCSAAGRPAISTSASEPSQLLAASTWNPSASTASSGSFGEAAACPEKAGENASITAPSVASGHANRARPAKWNPRPAATTPASCNSHPFPHVVCWTICKERTKFQASPAPCMAYDCANRRSASVTASAPTATRATRAVRRSATSNNGESGSFFRRRKASTNWRNETAPTTISSAMNCVHRTTTYAGDSAPNPAPSGIDAGS